MSDAASAIVLVVDDDDRIRAAVSDILRQAGYVVIEGRDAKSAAELIKDRRIDVVLTDIFMPDGDGFEMIGEIRRRELEVPVVVMSGGSGLVPGNYLDFAARLGATEVLSKPFTATQLTGAISRALSREAPAEEDHS